MRARLPSLALALALTASPAVTQPAGSHTADVTTVVVEVPVRVVTPEGAPVRDLTADDFELLDGRRRQSLTGFEVIDLATLGGGREGATGVPMPARRHFLLLFDLSFSDPGKLTRARHAARKVVAERLHSTDLVAVATYHGMSGPRWVLGFTPDRSQVDAAIEDLGLVRLAEGTLDPLALTRLTPPDADGGLGEIAGAGGNALTDALFQEHIEDLSRNIDRASRTELRGHALAFVQGVQALGRQLRWVQGSKHVVLFSQGFESSLVLGTENSGRLREMNEAAIHGEYWNVDSDERFGSSSSLTVLQMLYEEMRRADAVLHAIDVTGINADPLKIMERPTGGDVLFAMADATGGELYSYFNDLGEAMTQLLDRTSVTYLLSFQPEDLRLDGRYHPIRVRLKGGPPGARVLHRPGYYAPVPFTKQSPEARQITAAQLLLGGEIGGPIPVAALATPLPGAGETARVPLLLEIDGPALLAGAIRGRVALALYAYAFDGAGEVRDFVAQQMQLDLERVEPALLRRGLKFHGQLELPPGAYTTRILVQDLASGRRGVQEASFRVPSFAPAQPPALLPPLIPDAPADWLVLGERGPGERSSTGGGAGPNARFLLAGREFLPGARPTIFGGGETDLVLLVWGAGAARRQVEARVVDAAGLEVGTAAIEPVAIRQGSLGLEQMEARLRAIGVPPGVYTLQVRLVDPAGGEPLASSIPLVIAQGSG